jgi:hypothetical protein
MSAPMLELGQFASLEDALVKVEPGERDLDLGRELMAVATEFEPNAITMFWFSMVARGQALHSAIAREAREANPHAVFPLIRALTEAVIMMAYTIDHPAYIDVINIPARELPKDGPKRKSIQALINYASKQAPGLKHVYAELSEATHVGSFALWASHRIVSKDEDSLHVAWTSEPTWRSEEQALIACAQTLELAEALTTYLHNFAGRHVLPHAKRRPSDRHSHR